MSGRTVLETWVVIMTFLLVMAGLTQGRTITVGHGSSYDFNTIQSAIDEANDDDTVIVADGTYTGDGNRNIDFLGKAITLRSENGPQNCIIDCNGSEAEPHRGFYFHSGEDANSVLGGFTIINGYGPEEDFYGYIWSLGGAIYCTGSSPTVINSIICSNSATIAGGGILSWGIGPTLKYCKFNRNSAYLGGALCSSGGLISNCIFNSNKAEQGGGVFCHSSHAISIPDSIIGCSSTDGRIISSSDSFSKFSHKIINSTFTDNTATSEGGGIYCGELTRVLVSNCIFWADHAFEGSEIAMFPTALRSVLSISYSDVKGGEMEAHNPSGGLIWGDGNIDADPCFANPNAGDFYLKSQADRWYPSVADWTIDDATSPCIDAGDPMSPIGLEPFPNGGRANMGAYGGTAEASKSYFGEPPCGVIVAGDINGDCKVDFRDFAIIAFHWLEGTPSEPETIVEVSATTDKSTYILGEDVTVFVTAYNPNPEAVTLTFGDTLQASYLMDWVFDWSEGKGFVQKLTYVTIEPHESHTWKRTHGPDERVMYPLNVGKHIVMGRVVGYAQSAPVEFKVVSE